MIEAANQAVRVADRNIQISLLYTLTSWILKLAKVEFIDVLDRFPALCEVRR